MAKKKSTKKNGKRTRRPGRTPGGPNKSDFIRSFSAKAPAKEVVEAGKKKGLVFSQQLVYNVRAGGRKTRSRPAPNLHLGTALKRRPKDVQFRQLVVDLGVSRSRALVDEMESKLQTLVAG